MLLTTQRFTLVALATLLVSGCFDSKPTTEQLCKDHASLQCQQLNMRDGQCLNQREALILSRFEVLKSQSDLDKLNTIKDIINYHEILEIKINEKYKFL